MMHINHVFSLTVCFYIIYNDMVMVSKLISQYIVNKIRDIFYFFHGIFFTVLGVGVLFGSLLSFGSPANGKIGKIPPSGKCKSVTLSRKHVSFLMSWALDARGPKPRRWEPDKRCLFLQILQECHDLISLGFIFTDTLTVILSSDGMFNSLGQM